MAAITNVCNQQGNLFALPESLRSRCQRMHGWSLEHVERLVLGYRQFIKLKSNTGDWDGQAIAPSQAICAVWMLHLQYTDHYRKACQDYCGHFIHHDPDNEELLGNPRQDDTQKLLHYHFGSQVDEDIWSFEEVPGVRIESFFVKEDGREPMVLAVSDQSASSDEAPQVETEADDFFANTTSGEDDEQELDVDQELMSSSDEGAPQAETDSDEFYLNAAGEEEGELYPHQEPMVLNQSSSDKFAPHVETESDDFFANKKWEEEREVDAGQESNTLRMAGQSMDKESDNFLVKAKEEEETELDALQGEHWDLQCQKPAPKAEGGPPEADTTYRSRCPRAIRVLAEFNTGGVFDAPLETEVTGNWSCRHCTLQNPVFSTVCDACQRRRKLPRHATIINVVEWGSEIAQVAVSAPAQLHQRRNNDLAKVMNELRRLAKTIMDEVDNREDFGPQNLAFVRKPTELEDHSGYFKGVLKDDFVVQNFAVVPPGMALKKKADEKGVAFVNQSTFICDTHCDDFMNFLFVVSGKKEVYLANPQLKKTLTRDVARRNYFVEDPFTVEMEGWERVVVKQGDGILIPKEWLHCVRSAAGTVGVSLKIESEVSPQLQMKPQSEDDSPQVHDGVGENQVIDLCSDSEDEDESGESLVEKSWRKCLNGEGTKQEECEVGLHKRSYAICSQPRQEQDEKRRKTNGFGAHSVDGSEEGPDQRQLTSGDETANHPSDGEEIGAENFEVETANSLSDWEESGAKEFPRETAQLANTGEDCITARSDENHEPCVGKENGREPGNYYVSDIEFARRVIEATKTQRSAGAKTDKAQETRTVDFYHADKNIEEENRARLVAKVELADSTNMTWPTPGVPTAASINRAFGSEAADASSTLKTSGNSWSAKQKLGVSVAESMGYSFGKHSQKALRYERVETIDLCSDSEDDTETDDSDRKPASRMSSGSTGHDTETNNNDRKPASRRSSGSTESFHSAAAERPNRRGNGVICGLCNRRVRDHSVWMLLLDEVVQTHIKAHVVCMVCWPRDKGDNPTTPPKPANAKFDCYYKMGTKHEYERFSPGYCP